MLLNTHKVTFSKYLVSLQMNYRTLCSVSAPPSFLRLFLLPNLLIIKCSESECFLSCISSLHIFVYVEVEFEVTHNTLAPFKMFYVFTLNNLNLLCDARFSNET